MRRTAILAALVVAAFLAVASADGCVKRESQETGADAGHYCVCNSTYCDTAPEITKPKDESTYVMITSSKSGLRFEKSEGKFEFGSAVPKSDGKITVNCQDRYQEIVGFGGAITDAAGINIKNLSKDAGDNLLKSYFGSKGIGYTMIRTPMGSTDFSPRLYSYVPKENDLTLESFELQLEDYNYKIPMIKRAKELSEKEILIFSAPWSASPWMKTNNDWANVGKLKPEYRQLWADYFVKYFQAYRKEGIEFWATTPQNEPTMYIFAPIAGVPGMAWTPEEERDWVINNLSPSLKSSGFENLQIFVCDDVRTDSLNFSKASLENTRSRSIISGTAIHWYYDNVTSPYILDEIKSLAPEKLVLYTEACTGVLQEKRVILGSWDRGEQYIKNVIETLQHYVSSWVDWNMALDTDGGPTVARNFVDSPIIVNAEADEFYKQPMFYGLGHFAKYIPPGSIKIGTKSEGLENVVQVAAITPESGTVLVVYNVNEEDLKITVEDPRKGYTTINLPGKTIHTIKYW